MIPGVSNAFRAKLQEMTIEHFLCEVSKYTTLQLKYCIQVFFDNPEKEYFRILLCAYLLVIRKTFTLRNTYLIALRNLYTKKCPYIIVSKQFFTNCSLFFAKLTESNIPYTYCKDIPFENIFHIVNYLNYFTIDQFKQLLNEYVKESTDVDVYDYIKIFLAGRNLKFKNTKRHIERIQLMLSSGQLFFLKAKYKQWLEDHEFNNDVPIELFILDCAKRKKSNNLRLIMESTTPEKILQAFGQVYPDITVIVQYPYVK